MGHRHTSFLHPLTLSSTLSPFLDPLHPLVGMEGGGLEVRHMEAGDTLIHSQSQVCSCGNGVMEKERETKKT